MTTAVGYVARAAGRSLELLEFEEPALKDGEVRVAVTHCGVCHTDIHAVAADFGVFDFPLVPGHEIVGRVVEAGKEVAGLRVGDRVGVGWQARSCGACAWCRAGEPQLCLEIVDCGVWTPYGGFSSSVVVDEPFAYRLPEGLADEAAAVLMCAGVSVFAPLRRYAGRPGCRVGVVGVGGLGHLALQFAHALGADVTALSTSPGKEDEARGFGADHFLLTSDAAGMRKAEYAFDVLLTTSPAGNDWGPLLMTLDKRGRLVLPAFTPLDLKVAIEGGSGPAVDLVAHELSITGAFLGNQGDMREMLEFAHGHGITPRVETMPMATVNEALLRVKGNRARYRVVLVQN